MITLCGFALSNYYNKVKIALLEKGIPFAFILGRQDHRVPWNRRLLVREAVPNRDLDYLGAAEGCRRSRGTQDPRTSGLLRGWGQHAHVLDVVAELVLGPVVLAGDPRRQARDVVADRRGAALARARRSFFDGFLTA